MSNSSRIACSLAPAYFHHCRSNARISRSRSDSSPTTGCPPGSAARFIAISRPIALTYTGVILTRDTDGSRQPRPQALKEAGRESHRKKALQRRRRGGREGRGAEKGLRRKQETSERAARSRERPARPRLLGI